jgi:dihydrofolate reductase
MGVTLDGYVLGRGGEGDWGLPAEHPDVRAWKVASLGKAGTHIMGRVTYLEMADYWPSSTHVNAAPMNDIPKVVFSRTLREAPWPETTIAAGDTEAEIARLKAEPGGEIVAHGGTAFARSLIQLGLVDEYRFWVLPAAAGQGVALFTDFTRLRLRSSTAFPSGVLELTYAPADAGR